jgi:predicted CoA-substrate-specific enzyme activase
MKLGIDVGSTTVKLVLLDGNNIKFSRYQRHMSNIYSMVSELLNELYIEYKDELISIIITGSGGLSLSNVLEIPFEQEVICCGKAVEALIPNTDVAIELGGEDAKITFYGHTIEQRMNGTCAGGTGAFIDQMALLLNTDVDGLNKLAKNHKIIYPIAARCGVFAKTDIQPLINEGAAREDIAVSIFQAVVNQTITGLACGRQIKGNVAFLGGPLFFLSELRARFIDTLKLSGDAIIFPERSQYFVAIGAAMLAVKYQPRTLDKIINRLKSAQNETMDESKYLDPLFANFEEYKIFLDRHSKNKIKRKEYKKAKGKLFLGIDAGSTTTKAALIDNDGYLLYSYYKNNEGKPVESVRNMLQELYTLMPEGTFIGNSTVTGYGEGLVKAAFDIDLGEIETMAHYKAAEEFLPGVEFILDIGGQDMKCMKIKDGSIYNIMLNEACSSGCGSFLETYAKSVNMGVEAFSNEALFAKYPADLGTRCTVFMNSRVKQSQKEGASIGDVSAGLSYSVIKNALYKVIKLRDNDEAGQKIVVQGGTFLNTAVLRSIELILGKNVVRPDIAGIMGAYGAALIAKDRYIENTTSAIVDKEKLKLFKTTNHNGRCKLCENQCLLTISSFNDGSKYITGNRCEKGAGDHYHGDKIPNLYEYKYKRIFDYKPIDINYASRGTIGIPRVLNIYENYPFWFTFFTKLGFRVILSPGSTKTIYEMGMETISSDTACYPAKLVHGHIKWLIDNGVKLIFYPSINHELKEDENSQNHYNCPIVATYPEVIGSNMDEILTENGVEFIHPFLPYDRDERLARRLYETFRHLHIGLNEINMAVKEGRIEDLQYKKDVKKQGAKAIKYIKDNNKKAIILAGRPYHIDPEINHGIDKMIVSYGIPVISEDSIAHLADLARPIRVVDQWMYHTRLYKSAMVAGRNNDMELVQLNSFGCGIDAVTSDQVEEFLSANNKLYTLIKIDEGGNLGAAKIRIRSLLAAMDEREKNHIKFITKDLKYHRVEFTKPMKKDYTILLPQMSPIHFELMKEAFIKDGYNVELLPSIDKNAIDEGLKHINNDACYPTIVVIGQIILALKSGKYDLNKVAIFMSQTGGGCRASNYIALLRKALKDMKLGHIPVISINYVGLDKHSGFNISLSMVKRLLMASIYGDVLMRVLFKTRPYETIEGSANNLCDKWTNIGQETIKRGNTAKFKRDLMDLVEDFDVLELRDIIKPKVGVVGEILVKFHPTANNEIISLIESEGGEAVVPDLTDFFLYGMYSKEYNFHYLSGTYKVMLANAAAIKFIESFRISAREALKASKRFEAPLYIKELAEKAKNLVSLGNQCGEGWLLTAEMIELLDQGVNNIACLQPFACLPNHVTGKGMLKSLRKHNPKANIVAIDYDPGASEVNQINRIKLMMATAFKNIKEESEK